MKKDYTIENILELDGMSYCIDEHLGLWVKFEVKKVEPTENRPYGVKYSFTLHDDSRNRIMGFDNSHAIKYGGKRNVAPSRIYDHWHRDGSDEGRPYCYRSAAVLIQDFWYEVDKVVSILKEV